MTQAPHHTVLFNIAGITMLKLSVDQLKRVYSIIEDTMNGDGLYEGASKETILEAYDNQENPFRQYTWANMISEIVQTYELR